MIKIATIKDFTVLRPTVAIVIFCCFFTLPSFCPSLATPKTNTPRTLLHLSFALCLLFPPRFIYSLITSKLRFSQVSVIPSVCHPKRLSSLGSSSDDSCIMSSIMLSKLLGKRKASTNLKCDGLRPEPCALCKAMGKSAVDCREVPEEQVELAEQTLRKVRARTIGWQIDVVALDKAIRRYDPRPAKSPSYTGSSSPSSRSSSDLSFVTGSGSSCGRSCGSSWDLACDLDWVPGSGSSSDSDSDSSSGSSCGLDAENPTVAAQQSSRGLSTSSDNPVTSEPTTSCMQPLSYGELIGSHDTSFDPELAPLIVSTVPSESSYAKDGDLIGAPIWRSPEAQLRLSWDTSTDIWSFGALLTTLLYGDNFFIFKPDVPADDDQYELAILQKQCEFFGPFPLTYRELCSPETLNILVHVMQSIPPEKKKPFTQITEWEISADDKEFVLKIMKLDPRDRPSAAELLQDKWFHGA
ncbi:uncharacterized protein TRUGW13939_01878 [Talaromyces rugulosus]|uniref:Protein kinase domain-containing protein n=1 Tax=Talaromyces rugulosus TaxID=121627 RepID=A0A7H8QLH7_TALRU|nr:uncharacterized protein TRUGW13939_01878 [Talaromyces rugulosus]QKX54789.1 hypothetical protein TRUGW13939_01878 [Talaromyces rugulosus]